MKRTLTALAVFSLVALGVTVASATTSSTPTSVKACVNSSGVLALLANGKSCAAPYRPITIGVKGPKGARGAKGAAGPQGVAGPQGAGGAQGATGSQGAAGTNGTNGTPALYGRTVLAYTTQANDASPTDGLKRLETIGTFTKLNATSAITLTWTSHATGGNGASTFCQYALRIDGADDAGNTGTGYTAGASSGAVLYDANSAFSIVDVFTGLAAGSHTVSIWDRGNASSCMDNRGDFVSSVVVLETP